MRGSQMQVSPDQAQLLAMLVQILGAKRCIEVGVYTGYSSLAVALVLPESGVLVACERDKNSLEVAKRYYDRAGVSHKVDVRHGLAADTLNSMIENGEGCSYDFAFVDADKRMYQEYFELLLQLVRVGGLIVIDNVLWHGRVADPLVIDKKTESIRSFNKALVDDERVSIIMVKKDDWDNFKRPASEQQYSAEVEDNSQLEPSQNELNDLGQACNKLWELDYNRLTPGKDYEIDCGEGKKTYQKQDMADGSLFTWVNEDVLRKPTISRFCSLLDNYNPHEGYKEQVTSQEKQEQAAFIEEICRTAPIKYLHKYLCYKRIVSEDVQEFKRLLNSLWFDLYGRGGTSSCSSAFEHVFVGEIKKRGEQSVSGFHNWLQFYMEEAKGRVDYQGYIFPRRRGETPDSETQLLTIQFEWNGVLKSVSSTMIGVSPEFELALYTLCFYMGGEDNHIELGPYYVNVKCYRLGNKLGSAFPIADE